MEVPKEVKAGEKVNAQAEFIMLNHEGGKYMPLFTSLSELQKWNGAPDCKAVPMSMANYVAMLSIPRAQLPASCSIRSPWGWHSARNRQ
ncbi:MAG: SseB family protein [Ruminococcus callidus]